MIRHSKFQWVSYVLFCSLLASGCGHHQGDGRIVSDVQKELLRESTLNGYDIHINAQNGAVTLTGIVASEADRAKAEQLARASAGVNGLADNLQVVSFAVSGQPQKAAPAVEEATQSPAPPPPVSPPKEKPTPLIRAENSPPPSPPAPRKSIPISKPAAKEAPPLIAKMTPPPISVATAAPVEDKVERISAKAPAPEPSVELKATPSSITKGEKVKLTWHSTHASTLDLEPGIGKVKASGSRTIKPSDSTDYTLLAKGPSGSSTATASVQVTAPPPTAAAPAAANTASSAGSSTAPATTSATPEAALHSDPVPTANFSASKSTIRQGESITLTWSSSDATTAIVEPGPGKVAPNGSISVKPEHTTEYHLIARGPGGAGRAMVRVVVREPVAVTVPAGTTITVSLQEKVDETTQPSQSLPAMVVSPVSADGSEAIPANAVAKVTVAELKRAGSMGGDSRIKLALSFVVVGDTAYPVHSSLVEKTGPPRAVGMDTSALQVRLATGSILRFQLTSPLTVTSNP